MQNNSILNAYLQDLFPNLVLPTTKLRCILTAEVEVVVDKPETSRNSNPRRAIVVSSTSTRYGLPNEDLAVVAEPVSKVN